MDTVIKTRLDSSSIATIAYDTSDGALEVQFRRTGHFYRYFDVPQETYDELMESESKGAFVNQVLKPNFEYTRVDFPM